VCAGQSHDHKIDQSLSVDDCTYLTGYGDISGSKQCGMQQRSEIPQSSPQRSSLPTLLRLRKTTVAAMSVLEPSLTAPRMAHLVQAQFASIGPRELPAFGQLDLHIQKLPPSSQLSRQLPRGWICG
jgi:hypothetical protein